MTPGPVELHWRCPEDGITVIGLDVVQAETGVRVHFENRVHQHLSLSGFADGGPIIAGSLPQVAPVSAGHHGHGICPTCLASRASNSDMCPRCGTLLENREEYPPHPAVEEGAW